ncbi:coiled-coil domain-containing protein 43 isoform X1 [Xyrauchen texanus]|uniref:coiled-coil domain-containing protein 43 isoform X1 n=1 Tax=Xyrauchen texanus TaxID=154827 RepID=UPI00224219B1|nr:coiled-coil domain-containing protein 43 isoform X1 [Xyrauchen texanus]
MLLVATALLDCIAFHIDLEIRRQGLHVLVLEDREFPPRAVGVCKLHFTRDCFSNAMEVEMGFSKQLALKSDAVPNAAPPAWTPPPQRRLEEEDTLEEVCQQILKQWTECGSRSKVKGNQANDEVQAIASMIEKQAQIVVKQKEVSEDARKRKEALLAQYANVTDVEDEEEEEQTPVAIPSEKSLFKNTNVEDVLNRRKHQREQVKEDAQKKKEQDKMQREKDKLAKQDRKDKEKKRTQKGERKR